MYLNTFGINVFAFNNSSELLTLLNEHDDFFKNDDEDNVNEIIKLGLKDHNPDKKDEHKELLKLRGNKNGL